MPDEQPRDRVTTGVRNLDAILRGGIPRGNAIVLAGPPGGGKTILAQQICFHNTSAQQKILYFTTLSEPTAKMLRYLRGFAFFDAKKLRSGVRFTDIGIILRSKGLEQASALIMDAVRREKPAIVVIDSFKVFDELAKSREESRKFVYETVINMMAWQCTTLLLGEYAPAEYSGNPLFSVIDGLITVEQRESSGEQQRYLRVVKMRGTAHSTDEHAFTISDSGLDVYSPRVTIQRTPATEPHDTPAPRRMTGIRPLDALLGRGIPVGSSILVTGVAGTGKTVLLLEFLYRGALAGERGVIFSFEETEDRLRAAARSLRWDFDAAIAKGLIQVVFIPQPEVHIEADLLMMHDRIVAMGAKRVAVDSLSVFLHKVKDPQIAREKTFQLATIVQNQAAIGLLAADIPYGSGQISRFGVEETVVDGIIILSATEQGLHRKRFVEVYKLRTTDHVAGRHPMTIGPGGIKIRVRGARQRSRTK